MAVISSQKTAIPEFCMFEPSWHERGDCGPLSLFVLLTLLGFDPTIEEVKKNVPFDHVKGSSLDTLYNASKRFGLETEVLFVTPTKVRDLPPPFILHLATSEEKGFGHFLVVVGFDHTKKTIATINTDHTSLNWNPTSELLAHMSGYVLVPKLTWYQSLYHNENKWLVCSTFVLVVVLAFVLYQSNPLYLKRKGIP
jgi:ABC-type bacteriocin/lantibiotic exporter with double-glycine peptidase domain